MAVEREIVGRDSDAELIGGEAVLGLAPAGWGVACTGCGSVLEDLGETEKNWDRRFDLTEDALMARLPFPEGDEKDGELEEGSLEELLLNRRGIARGKPRWRAGQGESIPSGSGGARGLPTDDGGRDYPLEQ